MRSKLARWLAAASLLVLVTTPALAASSSNTGKGWLGCEEMLYAAAELDFKLAGGKAREAMVKTFYELGTNHPLANEYRTKLARLLY